jgi:acetyltransferase
LARDVDAVVARTGIRVLGPNTSGFFVPGAGLFASFVPGVLDLGAGSVAVVAASGGVNHVLAFELATGAGVSLGVGIGAGQDVTAPDVLRHLVAHEPTRAVILHIETVPDGDDLLRAVRELAAVKPVVALVVGRNDVGEFARSHTGALATSWRTTRAALRQAGAVLVDDESHAIAAATALGAQRARPGRHLGVGVVTAQAGPGLIVADALATAGVAVPRLADATVHDLGLLLPPLTFQANPVDTGRPSDSFAAVVQAVAADESIDAVGVYAICEPVIDLPAAVPPPAQRGGPIVLGIDGPADQLAAAVASARERDVPIVHGPTRLAQALDALVQDARARSILHAAGPRHEPQDLRELGDLGGDWDEIRSKELLERLGISCPPRRRCADRAEARLAFAQLGGPVVVKLVDAAVLHKSDIGGVVVGVNSAPRLESALDQLESVGATEFLVESMAASGVELVLGGHRDPAFGPVVLLGLGGTAAEVLGDVAIRTAPLSFAEADTMVDDLAASALLFGYRGGPTVDRAELARILVAIGDMIVAGSLDELEINPLRLTADGLVALDALVLPAGADIHKEVSTVS